MTSTSDLFEIHHSDAFDWLASRSPRSIHAVVTDPPFGIEYEQHELERRSLGTGIWRLPPSYDGARRQPLPRFTTLGPADLERIEAFFKRLAESLIDVLVPGGHVFIASTPVLSHLTYQPFLVAGFEKRGEVIRTVSTLRGGDRPKNAHEAFPDLSVLPRGRWEPWGLFRKPLEGTVAHNLRTWKAGALRRPARDVPFSDLIACGRTQSAEREIAPHPSLKPQAFLRQVVRAALPLGEGVILDPFMGSGSTIAAAVALGLNSIGIERERTFFEMAEKAIPRLSLLEFPLSLTNGNE